MTDSVVSCQLQDAPSELDSAIPPTMPSSGVIAIPFKGFGNSTIDWVVSYKTYRPSQPKYANALWQLRAQPACCEVSSKTVVTSCLSPLVRKFHGKLLILCPFIIHIILLVRVPSAEITTTDFYGARHVMYRRPLPWHLINAVNLILVFVLLLHFTNRDLLRRQLFAFDTVMIVGNYFLWFVTRAYSESCVFESQMSHNQYIMHSFETITTIPLMVISACLDSVKLARRTKCAVIFLLISERCFQYMRYTGSDGEFARIGTCTLYGVEIQPAFIHDAHLRSNITVIIFLTKCLTTYVRGGDFAVIKPSYKLYIRKSEKGECSLLADAGRTVSDQVHLEVSAADAKQPVESFASDCCGHYDQYELQACQSPPGASTPRSEEVDVLPLNAALVPAKLEACDASVQTDVPSLIVGAPGREHEGLSPESTDVQAHPDVTKGLVEMLPAGDFLNFFLSSLDVPEPDLHADHEVAPHLPATPASGSPSRPPGYLGHCPVQDLARLTEREAALAHLGTQQRGAHKGVSFSSPGAAAEHAQDHPLNADDASAWRQRSAQQTAKAGEVLAAAGADTLWEGPPRLQHSYSTRHWARAAEAPPDIRGRGEMFPQRGAREQPAQPRGPGGEDAALAAGSACGAGLSMLPATSLRSALTSDEYPAGARWGCGTVSALSRGDTVLEAARYSASTL